MVGISTGGEVFPGLRFCLVRMGRKGTGRGRKSQADSLLSAEELNNQLISTLRSKPEPKQSQALT